MFKCCIPSFFGSPIFIRMKIIIISVLVAGFFQLRGQEITSKGILDKSVEYHDPNEVWPNFNYRLTFSETRPSGPDRNTEVQIDNTRGYFEVNRNDEEIHGMMMDSCFIKKGDVSCDRANMLRNYYLYLWGLPMKLLDKGTPLEDSFEEEVYNGVTCYVLNVPYDKDNWFFYLDKKTFRMIAYMFFQEENKGEYILLEDELNVDGMKIPQKRSWYTLPDSVYLGTDILVSFERSF